MTSENERVEQSNATPFRFDLFGPSAQFSQRPQSAPFYDYNLVQVASRTWRWEFTVYDLRGGLNRQVGDYQRDFDRSSKSTLDTRFLRHLILPFDMDIDTTPDPGTPINGVHWAEIYDTIMIAAGDGTDALWKPTSSTNPALVATSTSLSPGANQPISCAEPVVFGGVTSALRLVCGRVDAVPIVIEDANGTQDATTPHASYTDLWGVIPTFVPDESDDPTDPLNLWYAGNGIYKSKQSEEISVAPTQTLGGVKAGGYALGMGRVGTAPVRAYWFEPEEESASGSRVLGSEVFGSVFSTNLKGTVRENVRLDRWLHKVKWAHLYRNGIIASDGVNVIYYDGQVAAPTALFADMPADSDVEYAAREAWVIEDVLRVLCNKKAAAGASGATVRFEMEFDFDSWTWHQVSEETTLTSTGEYGLLAGTRGLPWSHEPHYTYSYEDGSWYIQQYVHSGHNPFGLRKTDGATAGTGAPYAASGDWESPKWELAGIEGMVKEVMGVKFMGDIEAGSPSDATSPASITFSARGLSGSYAEIGKVEPNHTFPGLHKYTHRSPVACDKVQLKVSIAQGSGGTDPTRHTPNALPFSVWGYAYDADEERPAPSRPKVPGASR